MAGPEKSAVTGQTDSPPSLKRSAKAANESDEAGRTTKRPRVNSPYHMTAAIAHLEENQQKSTATNVFQSANPQAEALSNLMGLSQNATSPANTGPDPSSPSIGEPRSLSKAPLQIQSDLAPVSTNTLTSPTGSVTTAKSPRPRLDTGVGAMQSPRNPDGLQDVGSDSVSPTDGGAVLEDADPRTISYPHAHLLPQTTQPSRGMSLPGSSTRQGTRSPASSKKHRCPYCSTEFTRHHNLKSHLLTHSQEKPYVCSTCQSRFRRLHDLKRHTKLHTGERPHVCPKCNRKFARGDALARHNKGPGGCAGRRASMGSLGGDDDGVERDDTMDGIVYNEPETMEDEDGMIRLTPQIRRQAPSGDDSMDSSGFRLPSTYPPIQGRPPGSFPPPTGGMAPHSSQQYSNTGSTNLRPQGQNYGTQNPMTESPGPISPGLRQPAGPVDNGGHSRSTSSSQYAQPFPPRGSTGSTSLGVPLPTPHLPPPHTLNPPDARYTLPSQAGPTHPPTQPSGPPTHMSSGPLSSHSTNSSHGLSGHGSAVGSKGTFPTNEERLWAMVKSLEQQVVSMREAMDALRSEVTSLKQSMKGNTS